MGKEEEEEEEEEKEKKNEKGGSSKTSCITESNRKQEEAATGLFVGGFISFLLVLSLVHPLDSTNLQTESLSPGEAKVNALKYFRPVTSSRSSLCRSN